jgi:leucyl aminopeptidase (aminopeptidase T)
MTEALEAAYRTVLVDCLGVSDGESVIVLTDPGKRTVAERLVVGARALGAETVLMEMSERQTHGSEPPDLVAAAMLRCDVLIGPTSKSLSHTEARRAATAAGVRAATMPDITEEMLERTMSADYIAIRERSAAVANVLTTGSEVRITSEEGTDVTLSIRGREGLADDGDLKKAGSFGNLPAGEGFIAPVEGHTNGTIVFDGSIWPIGKLDGPLTVIFEDGYATGFDGPDAAAFRAIVEPHGPEAFAVAELGVGTNEKAILTGNVLEDEKILGTVHVAVGDNHSFGGTIRVSSHQDGIILHPLLTVDGKVLLEGGRLLV